MGNAFRIRSFMFYLRAHKKILVWFPILFHLPVATLEDVAPCRHLHRLRKMLSIDGSVHSAWKKSFYPDMTVFSLSRI